MGDLIWPPHLRLTFGGTIGQPPLETWSNTVRFHFGGFLDGTPIIGTTGREPDRDELQAMAVALGPAVAAWLQDPAANISVNAGLTWLKLNWVKADGKQRDSDTPMIEWPAQQAGGSKALNFPWYVTHCLTLRSGAKRGRAHAGRIFPPMAYPGMADVGSPYITEQKATDMATAFARALHNFETQIDSVTPATLVDKPHAIIVSPGNSQKGTQPLTANIVGVTCDRVPDVMHSRTNSVARAEGALVAPGP